MKVKSLLFILIILIPQIAFSQRSELNDITTYFDNAQYQECYTLLNKTLRDGRNSRMDLSFIYLYLGMLNAAEDQRDMAVEYYKKAISLNPEITLSENLPPKLTEPFEEVRSQGVTELSLSVEFPEEIGQKTNSQIGIIINGGEVAIAKQVVLYHRLNSSSQFRTKSISIDNQNIIQMPIPEGLSNENDALQFYIVLTDEFHNLIDRFGNDNDPYSITFNESLQPVTDTPFQEIQENWYQKWWVWTIIGAVVIGGAATGIALGLTSGEESAIFTRITISQDE